MHERILVVDDEPIVTEVVERYLVREGYRVTVVHDGRAAIETAAREAPDLIVLDLMLPGVDGLEVCRTIRSESKVPIIILSAKDEESDKILGLGLGADDYMAKPVSPRELVARVQAVLRRTGTAPAEPGDQLRYGGLKINPKARVFDIGDRAVELTAKEFDLLTHFARSPGRVLSRAQLLQQVWGYSHSGYEHTVNTHINRLRAKIERDPNQPQVIETVWGVGYRCRDFREAPARRA